MSGGVVAAASVRWVRVSPRGKRRFDRGEAMAEGGGAQP
jgi:hypothetical protein